MFRPVKNQHFSRNSLGRNHIRILGHVSRPIDFPLMVDLLCDFDSRLNGNTVPTEFSAFIIVVPSVECVRR